MLSNNGLLMALGPLCAYLQKGIGRCPDLYMYTQTGTIALIAHSPSFILRYWYKIPFLC